MRKPETKGAKGKRVGQQFERNFLDSIPDDIEVRRFHDSTTAWKKSISCPKCHSDVSTGTTYQPTNIADFLLYYSPELYYFELKSYAGKSLSFTVLYKPRADGTINSRQLKMMSDAALKDGVNAGLVVNFRDVDETYYMPIELFIDCKKRLMSKSIPIKIFREYCHLIPQKQKKINWTYDVMSFLKVFKSK